MEDQAKGWFTTVRDAAKGVLMEFTILAAFATSPIWFGACIFGAVQEFNHQAWSWDTAFLSTFSKGELLLFTVTFLSPTFWTVSLDSGGKAFPQRGLWVAAVALLLSTAVGIFALWRGLAHVASSYTSMIEVSIWAAIVALLLRFAIMAVHQRRLPSPEALFNNPTNDFVEEYGRLREAGDEEPA